MGQILEECPDALVISDDVCVYGKTEEEHDENLRTLMLREIGKKIFFYLRSSYIVMHYSSWCDYLDPVYI